MCEEGMNGVREEKLGHRCDIDEEKKKGSTVRSYLREIEKRVYALRSLPYRDDNTTVLWMSKGDGVDNVEEMGSTT